MRNLVHEVLHEVFEKVLYSVYYETRDEKQNAPLKKLGRNIMATYECSKCGMSVNATCGKCNEQLVNDTLKLEDGSGVQISKCPK